MEKVYLDSAATTQMRDEVIDRMITVMRENYGNPSSTHSYGRSSKSLIENARKTVAGFLNVSASEIVFTSGGTEADNLALNSAVRDLDVRRIITSPIEHHAVLYTVNQLKECFDVEIVHVKITKTGEVTSSYFCNEIPPSSPKVINEFKSVSGDVDSFLEITTSVLIGDDDDGDNISNVDEGKGTGKDTDGDSIPDYLDVDDDGDNVLTSTERIANPGDPTTDDGYLDTDIDGIANYLDDDDDDDTIPTRLEITSAAQSPTLNKNEANIAKYLDKFSKDEFDGEPNVITNNISLKYVSRLTAKNVKFKKQGDNGEEISYTSFVLGTFTSDAIRTEIIPTITEEEISSRTR